MRAALFGPVKNTDEAMGNLTETAIFSQCFHDMTSIENIYYARWKQGEVDIVGCDQQSRKPVWTVEVKWSDRYFNQPDELSSLIAFYAMNDIEKPALVTTLTKTGMSKYNNVSFEFVPSSLYCYTVGKNIVKDVPVFYGLGSNQK